MLRIAGVVDSRKPITFPLVGAPVGSAPQAPPDNVLYAGSTMAHAFDQQPGPSDSVRTSNSCSDIPNIT